MKEDLRDMRDFVTRKYGRAEPPLPGSSFRGGGAQKQKTVSGRGWWSIASVLPFQSTRALKQVAEINTHSDKCVALGIANKQESKLTREKEISTPATMLVWSLERCSPV